jgi:2-polyprenyl-3-methyl-5-hydroxy-6-metoxy-1,4-benzoquinol methylase
MGKGLKKMDAKEYHYNPPKAEHHYAYLLPQVLNVLRTRDSKRVFELGCGHGYIADRLNKEGFDVTGVDPSEQGIALGRQSYPALKIFEGSAYDDLQASFGTFPTVLSLEVVEHVYDPRAYAKTLYNLVEPGGIAVVSTPYHGYFKNVAIAIAGKWDAHHSPLWDHGHIKFWSIRTLDTLLREAGFKLIEFRRVGRFPALAKSMIAIAYK